MTGRGTKAYKPYGKTAIQAQIREQCHGCMDQKEGRRIRWVAWNSDYWKDELYARLHRTPPQVGAWRYPGDIAAEESLGHDLFRQLTAEERRPERRNRRVRLSWGLRPGRADNHYLDCATQLLALAEHLGMARLGTGGYTASPENPGWPGPAPSRPSAGPRLGGVRAGARRGG
jgi:phage terminase large subunit GpA-like protein